MRRDPNIVSYAFPVRETQRNNPLQNVISFFHLPKLDIFFGYGSAERIQEILTAIPALLTFEVFGGHLSSHPPHLTDNFKECYTRFLARNPGLLVLTPSYGYCFQENGSAHRGKMHLQSVNHRRTAGINRARNRGLS